MGKFISALKESLEIFSENPKLIVPKLLVSLFYSFSIVFGIKFLVDFFTEPDASMLFSGLAVIAIELASLALDTFVNLLYPALVAQQREGKKISFRAAYAKIASRFWRSVLPIASVLAAVMALSIFWAVIYYLFIGDIAPGEPSFILFILPIFMLVLAAAFIFYMIFPVSTIESNGPLASLKRSARLSLLHWGGVAKAMALSLALSGISFAIAFALNFVPEEQSLLFWGAFIVVRFLTAYIATFTYLLVPVLYFHYAAAGNESAAQKQAPAKKAKKK